ncbi:hypothetical protein BS78_K145000 [Paspalum vaginatum]|uniref:Mitochondrial import inner membrane translocase subunit Tim17/Tim22/Tim23 family protein n=1 Tax=Paspalum vaginatum TaxID=158149 RepID=A0A9W7X8J7_9POAL|nr:hypothetical protein BS78_K145000 [Paspalum vaginatum]
MEDSNQQSRSVDEGVLTKMGKGAGTGLAFGGVWGALASMLRDGPQFGSNGKLHQLIRTGKVCGYYGLGLAVFGATYVGVEQGLEKYRMKKGVFNDAAAGFAAGTVLGLMIRGGNFRTALLSGSAVALTSVMLDVTGLRPADEEGVQH